MSNHLHFQLKIPDPDKCAKLTVEELLELLPLLYSKDTVAHVTQEVERAEKSTNPTSRRQILELYQIDWWRTGNRYRMVTYDHGEERQGSEHAERGAKAGFAREKVEEMIEQRCPVSRAEILRCRLRYFCDEEVLARSNL